MANYEREVKMKPEIEVAACFLGQTAISREKNLLLLKSYQKDTRLSNLKEQIGEILLLLLTSNGQPDGWLQLEASLRQFYGVNL